MKLHNTIIYLIGIPAVGKYTTAKAIARSTGAKVIDNQLINNPIFYIAGYDGTEKTPVPKEAWAAIETIRRGILGFVRDHADPDASFVFTNVLQNAAGDRRLFRRIENLAKKRGGVFVPVWLTCDESQIRKRKNRPDRRQRMKDIDLTNIRYWLEEFDELSMPHANSLVVDTSNSKPGETARKILKHVAAVKSR